MTCLVQSSRQTDGEVERSDDEQKWWGELDTAMSFFTTAVVVRVGSDQVMENQVIRM